VVTVQSDALQEPSPGAERLESEPNRAVVPAQAPPASERELLVLEVGCGREAPAIARAALRRIQELDAARDDAILVASELVTNAVVHPSLGRVPHQPRPMTWINYKDLAWGQGRRHRAPEGALQATGTA
jgi:hypothetical protein